MYGVTIDKMVSLERILLRLRVLLLEYSLLALTESLECPSIAKGLAAHITENNIDQDRYDNCKSDGDELFSYQ